MKNCVATASYSCDPNKVWLYMTNPALNHWSKEVTDVETSDDGLQMKLKNTDGSTTLVAFSSKEKPRKISCSFERGKIKGNYTAILLGGGDSTSLECTLDVDGLGLFTKPKKLLDAYLDSLRQGMGV